MRRSLVMLLILLVLPVPLISPGATAHARATPLGHRAPSRFLDLVPSPVLYPWVVGKLWPRDTVIRLTVHYRGQVGRAELRAGKSGSFGVAIRGVRWCSGLVIEAVDATGYRVVLHGVSFRPCPPVTERGGISLHSLGARELRVRQYFVNASRPEAAYSVRVGDLLEVAVSRGRVSLRGIDRRYFRLLDHGIIPPCPLAHDCLFSSGVEYRVIALRPGESRLPVGGQRSVQVRIEG